jgi:hypothetical protein
MEKISEHITFEEAISSAKGKELGLNNNPNETQIAAMKLFAEKVFEPAREALGNKSIQINSFFRGNSVNKAVKGATNSKHLLGEACDMEFHHTGGNAVLFNYIKNNLDFDELIWEFGNDESPAWVHASYSETNNRKKAMRSIKENGETKYISMS